MTLLLRGLACFGCGWRHLGTAAAAAAGGPAQQYCWALPLVAAVCTARFLARHDKLPKFGGTLCLMKKEESSKMFLAYS